jgi:dihydroflavonol-4-reductase
MIIAVTGASGHIGANLVRTLLADGHTVRCLVHVHARALEGLHVEKAAGDLLDTDSLCRVFEGADVVYHLAARISLSRKDFPRMAAINVSGTRNVVEACLRTGVKRLVHFGSIHALEQEPLDTALDEERPLVTSPDAPSYDRTKALGIMEVQQGLERGLDAVTVLPTGVLGPYDYEPSYLGQVIIRLATGKLPALVAGGFDWVDARDVAAGAITAAEKAPAGRMYLLSGHWKAVSEIAGAVCEASGRTAPRCLPLGLAAAGAPLVETWCRLTGMKPLYTRMSLGALRSNRYISHERATRELGYRPRPFDETLADTFEWFRDRGLLTPNESK